MNSLTSAVAAVVTDDAGRVLLCQQSQGQRRWGLPGGRLRRAESPLQAAVRDIREETGMEIEIVDLVGLYQLTGDGWSRRGDDAGAADRRRAAGAEWRPPARRRGRAAAAAGRAGARLPGRVGGAAEATVNAPGRICRLTWHDPGDLPTADDPDHPGARSRTRSPGAPGCCREVRRDTEPDLPEAPSEHGDRQSAGVPRPAGARLLTAG